MKECKKCLSPFGRRQKSLNDGYFAWNNYNKHFPHPDENIPGYNENLGYATYTQATCVV